MNQIKLPLFLLLVFLVIFQFVVPSLSQNLPENVFWIKPSDEKEENKLNKVIEGWGSGFIAAGSNQKHHWITNLDLEGNTNWEIKLESNETLISLRKTDPNKYEAIFHFRKDEKEIKLRCIHFDNEGKINSGNIYTITGLNQISSIVGTEENDYLILGAGEVRFFEEIKEEIPSVIKIDKSGKIIWQKYLNCKINYSTFKGKIKFLPLEIVLTNNEGCLVIGIQEIYVIDQASIEKNEYVAATQRSWVVKMNKDGEIEWTKAFHRLNRVSIKTVIETNDNHFLLLGSNGYSWSWYDYWITKMSPKGEIVWERIYDKVENDNIKLVIQTSDKHYLVAGNFADYGGHRGISFLKIKNSDGFPLWEKVFEENRGGTPKALFEYDKDRYLYFLDNMAIKFSDNQVDIPIFETSIVKEFASEKIDTNYSVQTGAFENRNNAQNLAKELLEADYNAFIEKKSNENVYRVFVGVFPDITQAHQKAKLLKQSDYSTYVAQQEEDQSLISFDVDKYGCITFTSQPDYADIFINDVFQGKTPVILEAIPAGQYRLKLEFPEYRTVEKDFEIKALEHKTIHTDISEISKQESTIHYPQIEYELTEEGIIKPDFAKEIIEETADKLIYAISIKDSKTISDFIHPDKGVRFTPYTNVDIDRELVFNKEEVKNFFKDQNVYLWGHYDGSGNKISLTPSEYYEEFIYSKDFINAEEVGYNKVLSSGNMMENQFKVYENAIIVEYYFSGFDPKYGGMDWRSLRLVFEQYKDSWKLVGFIHNKWTI